MGLYKKNKWSHLVSTTCVAPTCIHFHFALQFLAKMDRKSVYADLFCIGLLGISVLQGRFLLYFSQYNTSWWIVKAIDDSRLVVAATIFA